MKRTLHFAYLLIILLVSASAKINGQACGAGTIRDTLNWDSVDFLPNINSYVTPTPYITLGQSQLQYFTFGTQWLRVNHGYSGANDPGENANHTGETGSWGVGQDVQFIGNGFSTYTFQTAVSNVRFSIYDIDRGQRVVISSSQNIAVSTLPGTILAITNNNTTSVRVDAGGGGGGTVVANNANTPAANGTINVSIVGGTPPGAGLPPSPGITTFTITVTNTGTTAGPPSEDGSYYISDISACSAGTFPTTYYNIAQPFTGQPAYVLAVRDNVVYYVNVANGRAKFLFTDPGHTNINSLAYDPYRHMVYYTYSLTASPSTDVALRRYDYDFDTLGRVTNDVRTLGIPTYTSGVESGANTFYNGSLYFGVEAGLVADREAALWKIDLNASYVPIGPAKQAYAMQSDLHDWGDVGIKDGILYDFDGRAADEDYYHKDLLTGNLVQINPSPGTLVPKQTAIDWTGRVYDLGAYPNPGPATIATYNYNGTIDATQPITFNGLPVAGSWGDAGEAFKPKTDFGDAPASYDPSGSDPATTEHDDRLRLGNAVGIEWAKKTSLLANGDGAEEDGILATLVIPSALSNYVQPVRVYNNSGANATLIGWIDKDGDGIFETGEAASATVGSSALLQTVNLFWNNIYVNVLPNDTTYLRLRITSAANGMGFSNPTGYFPNGEVEDYMMFVSVVLPDQNAVLKAQKVNSKNVNLVWDVNNENGIQKYELERSSNGTSWQTINSRTTQGNNGSAIYSFLDNDPYTPVSYFRVKIFKSTGAFFYTDIKRIDFSRENSICVSPNPAKDFSKLNIQAANTGTARISVLDYTGRVASDETVKVVSGANNFDLPVTRKLSNGVYKVRVQLDAEILVTTLVIVK